LVIFSSVAIRIASVYVKYRCECILDTNSMPELLMRCPDHGETVRDWSSVYKTSERVVIHWRDGLASFALHKVEYDQFGFPGRISKDGLTPVFPTTAELAHYARDMGLSMEEVSNIFNDRYIEYREFYSDHD
jgi:hypothetical protein